MTTKADYKLSADLIHLPKIPAQHLPDEYDKSGFKTLVAMQERHFWYRGRHRFLLAAVDRFIPKAVTGNDVIDLGVGVGGWVRYLAQHPPGALGKIALADSSVEVLKLAKTICNQKPSAIRLALCNFS